MASIPFVKATACGNDFLIVGIEHAPTDIAAFSQRICDRRNGVGADGVEWVLPASDADVAIRLLNADGSEAEISGNGTRCVAAWYCAEHDRTSAVIRTGAGLKSCDLISRDGLEFEFRTAMGKPEIGEGMAVELGDRNVRGIPVSMGNPHYVIFVPEFRAWLANLGGTDCDASRRFRTEPTSSWSECSTTTRSRCVFASAAWARPCPRELVRRLPPRPRFMPARLSRRCGCMLPAACRPWN